MTLTREAQWALDDIIEWVPDGYEDRTLQHIETIRAAVRAEQAAEVERQRAALLSVYSVHGPSGLDCECKGCVWYRAALGATPVAPAPNSPQTPAPAATEPVGTMTDDEWAEWSDAIAPEPRP